MSTQLTVQERASVALGAKQYEVDLIELVGESASIKAIKDDAGRQQAHGARMRLVRTRTEISKRGKEARDDATAFSKAVIAEEKRLIGIIEPEEARITALQAAWDKAREEERRIAQEKEAARIERHRGRIEAMRSMVVQCATGNAAYIAERIDALMGMDTSADSFEEFADQAEAVRSGSIGSMLQLHSVASEREAEAERLKAERAIEAERIRVEREAAAAAAAEQARKDEEASEAIRRQQQEEADRLAKQRAEIEAAQRAIAAQQAEIQRQQEAIAAAERARVAAEQAEAKRKADEEAEKVRAAEEAKRAEAEKARLAKEAEEAAKLRAEHDRNLAAARRTNELRAKIDSVLDGMDDDGLRAVLDFISQMYEAAA